MHKLVVAFGGSSGAVYSKLLLQRLQQIKDQWEEIALVASDNALINWKLEEPDIDLSSFGFKIYENNDFFAPFASGSARFSTMIICPGSMGLLARIAHGISDDLITRAADVILKERRKLIIVPREAPLSSIHLENMLKLSQAGAIVCPASPSFYSKPESIEELCYTVVDRVLDLAGFTLDIKRWGS